MIDITKTSEFKKTQIMFYIRLIGYITFVSLTTLIVLLGIKKGNNETANVAIKLLIIIISIYSIIYIPLILYYLYKIKQMKKNETNYTLQEMKIIKVETTNKKKICTVDQILNKKMMSFTVYNNINEFEEIEESKIVIVAVNSKNNKLIYVNLK